uniref:Uncharacterized protein n=1 Tax=Tanacetum cinerariifolium TaxID=118510 RepID=A0A6L2KB57_TANCI|nr:hypothetical protein [Tanacetum cinerariifolium]
MCSGDQEANVPNTFKKIDAPRKTRSLTIADNIVEEPVATSRLESMKQMKQAVVGEGSSVAHIKYYKFEKISATDSDATRGSSFPDANEEKDNETDDFDDYDIDLSDDSLEGDDTSGFRVFMYNKPIEPLISTNLSPTVTCSSLEYIQSLLNESPVNELRDFMSNPVDTNAQTTSMAKGLMQKAKKNMRKINFKKAAAKKFKEYDQKLEAFANVNVSKVIDKTVQAKVLIEMKKLLPTHISKAIANYVSQDSITRTKASLGRNHNEAAMECRGSKI